MELFLHGRNKNWCVKGQSIITTNNPELIVFVFLPTMYDSGLSEEIGIIRSLNVGNQILN